jgi:hypothetical protein
LLAICSLGWASCLSAWLQTPEVQRGSWGVRLDDRKRPAQWVFGRSRLPRFGDIVGECGNDCSIRESQVASTSRSSQLWSGPVGLGSRCYTAKRISCLGPHFPSHARNRPRPARFGPRRRRFRPAGADRAAFHRLPVADYLLTFDVPEKWMTLEHPYAKYKAPHAAVGLLHPRQHKPARPIRPWYRGATASRQRSPVRPAVCMAARMAAALRKGSATGNIVTEDSLQRQSMNEGVSRHSSVIAAISCLGCG